MITETNRTTPSPEEAGRMLEEILAWRTSIGLDLPGPWRRLDLNLARHRRIIATSYDRRVTERWGLQRVSGPR